MNAFIALVGVLWFTVLVIIVWGLWDRHPAQPSKRDRRIESERGRGNRP